MWNWTKNRTRRAIADDPKQARVLLVTRDPEYRTHWQQVFTTHAWELASVETLAQAVVAQQTQAFPVVVYDCNSEAENWQDVLNALRKAPQAPCVLLTSNVIDESFRDEVVRLHGYDVLSRHADEDELTRTINSAWFWKHHHA